MSLERCAAVSDACTAGKPQLPALRASDSLSSALEAQTQTARFCAGHDTCLPAVLGLQSHLETDTRAEYIQFLLRLTQTAPKVRVPLISQALVDSDHDCACALGPGAAAPLRASTRSLSGWRPEMDSLDAPASIHLFAVDYVTSPQNLDQLVASQLVGCTWTLYFQWARVHFDSSPPRSSRV